MGACCEKFLLDMKCLDDMYLKTQSSCGLPAQDGDSQHSIVDGRENHEAPPLAEELLAVYFQGCGCWQVAHAPEDGCIPMHMQAELAELHGVLKMGRHEVGKGCGDLERVEGGVGCVYD